MHTHFLGTAEVKAYAADLVARLIELGAAAPKVWVALGISGDKMAEVILDAVDGTPLAPTSINRAAFDRTTRSVDARQDTPLPSNLGDEAVLVIDGAIHSGTSMRHLVEVLHGAGCANVMSYSLVMKATTEFVPSHFGLIIGEHDRAFFQLDRIPNNRLTSKAPFGAIRRLREDDVHAAFLSTGVDSIDRLSYGDLWYDVRTTASHVYLYELGGRVAGLVHFKLVGNGRLFLDLIATEQARQGSGVGGALMRWVETFARASRMQEIRLWAIEERRDFYSGRGYEPLGDSMDLGGEVYHLMRRKLLYNLKPEGMLEAA